MRKLKKEIRRIKAFERRKAERIEKGGETFERKDRKKGGNELKEGEMNVIKKNGYSMPLLNMPLFSVLSNIEFKPFNGGSLCRAADTSSMLIGKTKINGILKLNSN